MDKKSTVNSNMHLELSLPMVFSNAVILAGSSVEAVAHVQDGGEQGAGELITDFDGQLDRLRGEKSPCQEAVNWSRKHKGHVTVL